MQYQRLLDGPASARELPADGRPPPRGWDAAPDLERFLASFYQYFEHKGFWGVLAAHLSNIAMMAFTIGFSFVLFFFVNWHGILSCSSEESCRAVPLYFEHPFHHVGPWRLLAFLSFLLFVVYWLFHVAGAYTSMLEASKMSVYYKDRLGITSDEILSSMLWSEVVSRLMQQQKMSPFCIVQDELTALEIANIIMREDNFMIALTNHNAFTSHLPAWFPARLAYTRVVHWSLRTAIFRSIFDARSRIHADFLDRPLALARRLQWLGVLNLVLMVPVLLFVTIFFFMRHAEEFRSHRTSPFERQWTGYAHWTFREFNELPHHFMARMCHAQAAAESYVRSTREASPVFDSVRRFTKFVAGSILAVLLVVALYDDSPLLFVKILDKNLLWYLALFGFLFTVADSAQGVAAQQHHKELQSLTASTPLHMYIALMKLVRCTHYLPASWRSPAALEELAGDCGGVRRAHLCEHFRRVRSGFLRDFFVHRIQALAEELLGVVLCPLLLMAYLPQAAPEIVDVIRRSQHASKNLGDWCALGCLDPARNGSDWYGSPLRFGSGAGGIAGGSRSSSATEPPSMLGWGGRELGSHGGKLEKSAVSFLLAHRLPWLLREGDEAPLPSAGPSGGGLRRVHALGRGARQGQSARWGSAAGRDGEEIAMRDLSADAASASEEPPAASQEQVGDCAGLDGADAAELWGHPLSALQLLRELEEFQEREMGPLVARAGPWALLPEELVGGGPGCGQAGPGAPSFSRLAVATVAARQEEQAGCGPLFFWLEAMCDARSGGRNVGAAGRGGGHRQVFERAGAAGAPPHADEAVFELLERDGSP